MNPTKDILIIGAGIIGTCAAYHLVRRGYRVCLVDRQSEQYQGCSHGNAGMVVPSHFIPLAAPGMVALGLKWMWNPRSPFYVRPRLSRDLVDWGWKFWQAANSKHVEKSAPLLRDLHLASRQAYEELASEGHDFGLQQRGLLMLCQTVRALQEEAVVANKARALGIPAEVLDARQTAALDPGVTLDIAGAVYFPADCHLSPASFMSSLRARLDALGVQFLYGHEITGWRFRDRRIEAVRTAEGELTASEYVLCSGVWTTSLLGDLSLRLPMQAGKGYSLTLPHPPEQPAICSILTEARVAVTPLRESLRFGGTMEIAGLDESVSATRVRGIIEAAARYFPKLKPSDFDGIKPWVGLRPCSPDGLPYLGRTASFSNLTIATGHAMMGLSLGPVSGRLIAEIISGEPPDIDLSLLNPDRYN